MRLRHPSMDISVYADAWIMSNSDFSMVSIEKSDAPKNVDGLVTNNDPSRLIGLIHRIPR